MKVARFKFWKFGIIIKIKNFLFEFGGRCISREYIVGNKEDITKIDRTMMDYNDID